MPSQWTDGAKEEEKNVQNTGGISLSPHHATYWRRRIFRKSKRLKDRIHVATEWSVKLQHDRRREAFCLRTASAKDAAAKAKAISEFLREHGWEATRRRFKGKTLPAVPGEVRTLGELIAVVRTRFTRKASTLRCYEEAARQIMADLAGITAGREKFDHVHGGNLEWRDRVNAKPISLFTPSSLREWRTAYVARAGADPLKRKSAERTAAGRLRCTRALFSQQLTEGVGGLEANPFLGMKIPSPRATRYRSDVDPAELLRAAEADLRRTKPQQFLGLWLCLWAGLRRKEADLLAWDQVDEKTGQIRIRRTRFFDPKSDEAERDIDLPPAAMAVLLSFRAKKAHFVMAGVSPRPGASYNHYRAQRTWKGLLVWLRSKGIADQKAIHTLRKESGSLIAQRFGIEAARAHLGHRDIQTTSAHYVSKKERREVEIVSS